MEQAYERAICPICRKSIEFTDQGVLKYHMMLNHGDFGRCLGSGQTAEWIKSCFGDDLEMRTYKDQPREKLPLRGWRLRRWKMACRIFRIGCLVGGRHERTLKYDEVWREWFCPRCGWVPDDED